MFHQSSHQQSAGFLLSPLFGNFYAEVLEHEPLKMFERFFSQVLLDGNSCCPHAASYASLCKKMAAYIYPKNWN